MLGRWQGRKAPGRGGQEVEGRALLVKACSEGAGRVSVPCRDTCTCRFRVNEYPS